jgi:hypothetical protein
MQLSTGDCIEVTKENSSTLLDSGNSACTCKAK